MTALAIDLDAVLGDTRPLWREWLEDVVRRARVELDVEGLAADPGGAEGPLDAAVGNWRELLERFAEEHVPVHLRPSAEASAALRRLAGAGVRLGAFTEVPEPLARVAARHLGAARRLEALETGAGARERLLRRLGPGAEVVSSREELASVA